MPREYFEAEDLFIDRLIDEYEYEERARINAEEAARDHYKAGLAGADDLDFVIFDQDDESYDADPDFEPEDAFIDQAFEERYETFDHPSDWD